VTACLFHIADLSGILTYLEEEFRVSTSTGAFIDRGERVGV
jgi:hypothetical protein